MKYKSFILVTYILFSSAGTISAKGKKVISWLDATVKAKTEIQTKLKEKKMSVSSSWIRKGQKPEHFTVNVEGMKKLVLVTTGGADGNSNDHGIWANARLITKDGKQVWLDKLDYEYGVSGWKSPRKNRDIANKYIYIAQQKYDHGILCSAEGMLVYDLGDKYIRFEAEVGIDDRARGGSVYFKALGLNPADIGKSLAAQYPAETSILAAHFGGIETWLVNESEIIEKEAVNKLLKSLKNNSFFSNRVKEIETMVEGEERTKAYLNLLKELNTIVNLQAELQWLNIPALKLAYADLQKQKGFDVAKYQPMYDEVLALAAKGFDGIYNNNPQAIATAQKALSNRRAILLGNPLLDSDKIVAARYKIGVRARDIMTPELGTQSNNWSNQESARRSGFDAEIVELSNLRGENIRMRQVYKPTNGSSIADLRLHWNGDRVMFTQTRNDKRWNIFEVKLDGSGLKELIKNEEPDLEFYDGTYLPDGRILAISNIGYQGVPCVNGSDPVGNLVLYTPQTGNLRRITFDQDANWNPVVMNNGRVMYTRWEYTDLTHYYSRIVMHMNPDGTENKALYGSGAMFPNSTFDIQPLPGHGSAFVGIISGHHGVARSGRLILFDPSKGRKSVSGMTQEIPHRNRLIKEVIKDRLVDGVWPQFIKPTPLSDKYFLVAAKLSKESL